MLKSREFRKYYFFVRKFYHDKLDYLNTMGFIQTDQNGILTSNILGNLAFYSPEDNQMRDIEFDKDAFKDFSQHIHPENKIVNLVPFSPLGDAATTDKISTKQDDKEPSEETETTQEAAEEASEETIEDPTEEGKPSKLSVDPEDIEQPGQVSSQGRLPSSEEVTAIYSQGEGHIAEEYNKFLEVINEKLASQDATIIDPLEGAKMPKIKSRDTQM